MPSILTNVAALQASRQLGITSMGLKQTIERLTTGKRINHASDDASGLATANTFSADARVAHENRKLATQTFYGDNAKDGYLEEASNQVMRAIELAAGGNVSAAEFSSVAGLVATAVTKASTATGGTSVGITGTVSGVTDLTSASAALTAINAARSEIASTMAKANSNANLYGIEYEGKTAMSGNIMDADIGAEVVNLTKWQILSQSGTSALTSANQSSQTVLGLLR